MGVICPSALPGKKPKITMIGGYWTADPGGSFRTISAPSLKELRDRWIEMAPRSFFDKHGDW